MDFLIDRPPHPLHTLTDFLPLLLYEGFPYPARARARRACALRALGLLLADGVLTVGWGKTFWRVGRVPTRKRP